MRCTVWCRVWCTVWCTVWCATWPDVETLLERDSRRIKVVSRPVQRAECGEAGRGQERGRRLTAARQRRRRLVERQRRTGQRGGVTCAAHCVLDAAPRRLGVAVLLELAGDSKRGEGVAGRSVCSLRCRSAGPLHPSRARARVWDGVAQLSRRKSERARTTYLEPLRRGRSWLGRPSGRIGQKCTTRRLSVPVGNPRGPLDRGECPACTSTPWEARLRQCRMGSYEYKGLYIRARVPPCGHP